MKKQPETAEICWRIPYLEAQLLLTNLGKISNLVAVSPGYRGNLKRWTHSLEEAIEQSTDGALRCYCDTNFRNGRFEATAKIGDGSFSALCRGATHGNCEVRGLKALLKELLSQLPNLPENVVIFSDSLGIVSFMHSKRPSWRQPSPGYKLLYSLSRKLSKSGITVQWRWMRREKINAVLGLPNG